MKKGILAFLAIIMIAAPCAGADKAQKNSAPVVSEQKAEVLTTQQKQEIVDEMTLLLQLALND